MDAQTAQLHRPAHQYEEEDPHHHSTTEGEHNHHGHKSVLKKVKDKAKKLKDTIKHHGHGHDHHDQYEEADDDDEEMDQDPEVHGAPMYDTTVITGTDLPMQVDANLEKPTDPREDRYEGTHPYAAPGTTVTHDLEKPHQFTAHQPHLAQIRETLPLNTRTEPTDMRAPIGAGLGHLETDPHAPGGHDVPRYQAKVNDPTGHGGQETNVDPLIHKLENLDVGDKSGSRLAQGHGPYLRTHESKVAQEHRPDLGAHESKLVQENRPYTGTHDQFAPQATPTEDDFKSSADNATGYSDSLPKSVDPANPDMSMAPQDTITGKIVSATTAITEKASSATSAIAGKAVAAKDAVASKLGYGAQEGVTGSESSRKPAAGSNAPPTTTAIAEKAVAAKDAVASKLGFGEQECVTVSDSSNKPVTGSETPKKPMTETATEYAHAIADKLAPVYGKVAGAGTAVMAKVQGSGGSEYDDKVHGTGATEQQVPDKGVSVKQYLAEKFRPGDEDKALSEAISDALHLKKETVVVEEQQQQHPVMGKVTESKEVRERLGTGKENKREGEDAFAAGNEVTGSGPGVVDKIKGAVTSWIGKSTGMETAQESVGQSYASGTGSGVGGRNIGHDGGDSQAQAEVKML